VDEVIGQGREPDGPLRSWHLPHGGRGRSIAAATVVLAVGGWALLHGSPHALDPLSPPAAPTVATGTPSVPAQRVSEDLRIDAAPGTRSFLAISGHILLFLLVRNVSHEAVRVDDVRVPQNGAYPDAGAGGLTAQTLNSRMILPDVPTDLFVRTRVDCTVVLSGSPTDHLAVTEEHSSGPSYSARLDLRGLGTFWDEARRAACVPPPPDAAVLVSLVPGSLTEVTAGADPLVTAQVTLHDLAGLSAVVRLAPGRRTTGPSGTSGTSGTVSVAARALHGNDFAVDGGSSRTTQVSWTLHGCPPGGTHAPLTLALQVELPSGIATVVHQLDPTRMHAPDAWAAALAEVCR
jgi:hypothetical protein